MSALGDAVLAAFAPGGPLRGSDPQFRQRPAQIEMARAVAQAIEARGSLVVEAGTGIGKTFAYLVPALLSGARVLVSTATKTLQDQLYLRDLPRLTEALGAPVSTALLKGRASYVCLHRLSAARQGATLPDRASVAMLARIERWSLATRSGDLAEVEGLDERSPLLPLVTSTRDNCLGSDCPRFRDCHVMQARRQAMAADVVVVNHHLFFADLALREGGVAELLPTVDALIFDEAHQVNEIGIGFLGRQLATAQALDLTRDLLAAGLQHARGLQPWNDIAAGCDRAARDLRLACGPSSGTRSSMRRRWSDLASEPAFTSALDAAQTAFAGAATALDTVSEIAPDFPRLTQRCREVAALAGSFAREADDEGVRWVDVLGTHARLVESPLDIRTALAGHRIAGRAAWIFTSATLGDDERLAWFTTPTGLDDATVLRIGSPFDYSTQARLWLPGSLPLPNAPAHATAVAQVVARLATVLGGRTFVLTTTLRAIGRIADELAALLDGLAEPIDLLVQGRLPKRELLRRFVDPGRAVLVGSQSFWEGVDLRGEALQCVVIDKLPFPPPDDPLVEARSRRLRRDGRNPFSDLHLAETAVSLKQGAGRLIRSESDRGLLVLCDARLRSMAYGKRLLAALPPMSRVESEDEALAWVRELVAATPRAEG